MKEKFYAFLKSHHAYDQFVKGCLVYIPQRNVEEFIERELSNNNGDMIFEKAFSWRNTIRGQKYWNNLSNKWRIANESE